MDTSLLLARLIGPLFVTVGVGALLNPSHYAKMVARFLSDPQLYYFSGATAFVVGLAIILHHNLWVADWRVFITVIGWMSLVKGVARIIFFNCRSTICRLYRWIATSLNVGAAVVLLFGLFLSYQGYGG